MSNEKETKRPLDVEELNEAQLSGIAGGEGESESGKKPKDRKKEVRFNASYLNVSDRD